MSRPSYDPGLTQTFGAPLRRVINEDGTFNVRRRGTSWRDIHPYLHLINMPWPLFLLSLLGGYLATNCAFALVYFALGPGHLQGSDSSLPAARFLNAFFFSAHTLTTVGYGTLAPLGVAANTVAVFEAMIGVLGFAVATGLLYGRVSRPSARIGFSERLLMSPYHGGVSLQFRVVNKRPNALMDLDARVLLMTVEGPAGEQTRQYRNLTLERPSVLFLPMTWTVVHPIDEASPLHGKTIDELRELQAEVLVLIRAYDDTFSQTVHARYSYRWDAIQREARFVPAFHVDAGGDIVLDVDRVGEYHAAA